MEISKKNRTSTHSQFIPQPLHLIPASRSKVYTEHLGQGAGTAASSLPEHTQSHLLHVPASHSLRFRLKAVKRRTSYCKSSRALSDPWRGQIYSSSFTCHHQSSSLLHCRQPTCCSATGFVLCILTVSRKVEPENQIKLEKSTLKAHFTPLFFSK